MTTALPSPRRAQDVAETVNSLLGLALTTVLTWLVLRRSPREATRAYRRVLLITCAMYYLTASAVAVKVQLQIEPTEGRVFIALGGWWRWEEPWNRVALGWVAWVSLVYYLVLPLQSTYRYLVICRYVR
jgi:Serpentine type 7TM GPCR chemoreceptor Str